MRALVLCLALAACAPFPALDARLTAADRAAPYPALIPLGPVLAIGDAAGVALAPADLAGRAAGLAARAAALRRPVLTATDRDRLSTPVAGGPPLG